jgi:predicted peroxiredoxin
VLKPGESEKIKLGSFPSVREMIDKSLEMGIEFYVCEASKRMLEWDKVELIPNLKIVGAATLNDLVLEADATMWF